MRHAKGLFAGTVRSVGVLLALLACGTAAAACKLGKLVELPVTMVDIKPVVAAQINGRDANFVADSGAFYGFLTPASAAEFKLRTAPGPMPS